VKCAEGAKNDAMTDKMNAKPLGAAEMQSVTK
jgi:hypothetical protein